MKAKQDDLSKKSVSEWIYELNAEKNLLEEKIQSGKSAFVKLDYAHGTAKTIVNQIEVGLSPPNFKHSDDEELKEAVRACRVEQYEIIKEDKATTSLSRWSWFGSEADGAKLIRFFVKVCGDHGSISSFPQWKSMLVLNPSNER